MTFGLSVLHPISFEKLFIKKTLNLLSIAKIPSSALLLSDFLVAQTAQTLIPWLYELKLKMRFLFPNQLFSTLSISILLIDITKDEWLRSPACFPKSEIVVLLS